MIDTRVTTDITETINLCETFSTEGYKLRQIETDKVYGSSVIDIIEGMNGDKPFSRYTYEETDELDESLLTENEEDTISTDINEEIL